MNILLLNPPCSKTVSRGNYCSNVTKADYYLPPADLILLSGILDPAHKLTVLDAIAEKLSANSALRSIQKSDCDAIIFLTGAISENEDMAFLKQIKQLKPEIFLIGSGDILLFEAKGCLTKYPFIDAIIMDFTSLDILKYLDNEFEQLQHIVFREKENIHYLHKHGTGIKHYGDRRNNKCMEIGIPRHDLFPLGKYRIPHGRRNPFTLTMLSYGCPYNCTFCTNERILYKYRSVDESVAEMKYIQSFGIKEVYFVDPTFGARKRDTIAFCKRLIDENIDLTWSCPSRVDVMDEELLTWMKRAGCHTIHFGVESGNNLTLEKYNKGMKTIKYHKIFHTCQKLKIRTLASFIIGLPGETKEDIQRTIDYAIELKCDYASFNIAQAWQGTTMYEEALASNMIGKNQTPQKSFLAYECPIGPDYMFEDVIQWRNNAIKQFYLRPSYIVHRLFDARSVYEIQTLVREGTALLKTLIFSQK